LATASNDELAAPSTAYPPPWKPKYPQIRDAI